jgi:hypothetical protein
VALRGERTALRAALDELGADGARVTITRGGIVPAHPNLRNLVFSGRLDTQTRWKDLVAAGVFAARGFGFHFLVFPGGDVTAAGYRQLRPIGSTAVQAAAKRAAERSHARLDNMRLRRPFGYAPVVTITVVNRTRFTRHGGFPLGPFYRHRLPGIEGIYLLVRDGHGRVWAQGGIAFREGGGAGYWPGATHLGAG